jgi:hypothetical protein
MTIYLAIVVVVFGPLCLMAFIRTLAKRFKQSLPKPPDQQRRPPSARWCAPERIGGPNWKN